MFMCSKVSEGNRFTKGKGFKMFDAQSFEEKKDGYLGVALWYTIHDSSLPIGVVEKALEDNGFDKNLVRQPTPKKALRRAALSFSGSNKGVATLARKIHDGASKVVFGIVDEHADVEHELLNYNQGTTARLSKETGNLEVQGKLSKVLMDRYETQCERVNEEDIRSIVLKIVRMCNGVFIRKTGGIYFVPKTKANIVSALDKFLSDTNTGTLYAIPYVDTQNERNITWEALQREVEERVSKISNAVDVMKKRAACIGKQSQKLEEVKKMLAMYQNLCQENEKAEELRNSINDVGKFLEDKMQSLIHAGS
jgi:hypothetical protein